MDDFGLSIFFMRLIMSISLCLQVDRCSVQNTSIAVTAPKIDDAGDKRHSCPIVDESIAHLPNDGTCILSLEFCGTEVDEYR